MRKHLFRFTCLLIAAAALICGCSRSPEKVSFADVCQRTEGSLVSMEGFLQFPATEWKAADQSESAYNLIFVEQPNGTGGFLHARVKAAKKPEPNRMMALAQSYTYEDFHVFTDGSKPVSPDEKIRVTGTVVNAKVKCEIQVEKIETP